MKFESCFPPASTNSMLPLSMYDSASSQPMSFAFLMISWGASSRVMNTASSPSSRPRRRNCVANVVFPAPGEPITTVVVCSLIPPSIRAFSP